MERNLPSISIVMPAFNAERFIGQTLQSVCDQTIGDWECIIVDDGSTDGTAGIVQRFVEMDSRFRLHRLNHAGVSRARNAGLDHLDPSAQFVSFLDCDDLWTPDALEVLRRELEQFPQAVGAHGLGDLIDERGASLDEKNSQNGDGFADFGRRRVACRSGRLVTLDLSTPTTFESLYPMSRLYPTGLVLIRQEALKQVGGFDPAYSSVEDWDLWLRLARRGEFRFLDRVVIHYRRHGNNATNNIGITNRSVRRLLCKHYFSRENNAEQKQIVRRGFRAFHATRLSENMRSARENWAAGHYRGTAKSVAKACHHASLYIRGFPTPLGI